MFTTTTQHYELTTTKYTTGHLQRISLPLVTTPSTDNGASWWYQLAVLLPFTAYMWRHLMVSGMYNIHTWADHMTALSRGARVCALLTVIKLYATFAMPRLLNLLYNNVFRS